MLQLTRRKTQLELLEQACEARRRVRVARLGDGTGEGVSTRFLAIQPDGLLLDWPQESLANEDISGALLAGFFEHQGRCYGFRTTSCGRAWWLCSRRGRVAAWKLALPLRVELRRQRGHCRISLADIAPIPGRCTSVLNPERTVPIELHNISCGGLLATAPPPGDLEVCPDQTYWMSFDLPGDPASFEFVVRVVHKDTVTTRGRAFFGCMFCPSEDPTVRESQLQRIEQFVATQQQVRQRRAGGRGQGG
jgi:hypothetical protein